MPTCSPSWNAPAPGCPRCASTCSSTSGTRSSRPTNALGTGDPLPEVAPDDIAQIVYTSGTTGTPKGARLTHRGLTNAARVAAERFGIREGDVYVDPLPLFYVGGQTVALEIVQQRATYVMLGAFDPGALLDLLETERATLTVAVPTVLRALLERSVAPRPRPRRAAFGELGRRGRARRAGATRRDARSAHRSPSSSG